MRHIVTTYLGKSVRKIAQLRGGGSALPGLIVEKIDQNYVRRALSRLPMGIVLISGTNGKTTTTKMVVELLESQGLGVFTNRTGSNFTRGVAAALIGEADRTGTLRADIAVLELDEAYAVHFVKAIAPTYSLLLNVMRDQLDRFGEIDMTAELLHTVARYTTNGVVINRDDPRLVAPKFIDTLETPYHTYGVATKLLHAFPSDDALHGSEAPSTTSTAKERDDTELTDFDDQLACIAYSGTNHTVPLRLKGMYNVHNAVGAVALTRMIMGNKLNEKAMLDALSKVTPAFGRGESIHIGDIECELVLVKNPAGFRLSLNSFDSKDIDTMIAINDDYADGRDMSWLWDVNFESLMPRVCVVSGIRAYDMALRLQYDKVPIGSVEPTLADALEIFLKKPNSTKRIYCTYTAMLALRRELAKHTDVEVVR
ncbi:MAG: DUF1727 domain-containing protein [Candidatus Saccharimonas sp.]|nr:DUF1727 domain-containing protein [Candidatus Saccharimonas sp.]